MLTPLAQVAGNRMANKQRLSLCECCVVYVCVHVSACKCAGWEWGHSMLACHHVNVREQPHINICFVVSFVPLLTLDGLSVTRSYLRYN